MTVRKGAISVGQDGTATPAVIAVLTSLRLTRDTDFRVYWYGVNGVWGALPACGPASGLGFPMHYRCAPVTYLWLDKLFDFPAMVKDVSRRPFITAGFAAFACLVPLALTSTAGWIRRLGGSRWQRLHSLVYVTAAAAVAHYYWLVKSDIRQPMLYATLVALLLCWRVVRRWGML